MPNYGGSVKMKGGNMGGMVRLLATIGAKGVSKFLKRRKQLGGDKAAKSAAAFVKRRKQLNKGKPDLVKQSGPSKKEVIGYGTAAAAGLGASSIIKNRMKKKAGGYRDGGSVRNFGTPSMMEMMRPRERAEYKRKKMKEMGLKPGDLEKKPGKRPPTVKKMAQGLEPKEKFEGRKNIRPRIKELDDYKMKKKPKLQRKFALGGEAAESVGRATVEKRQRAIRRQAVDDMLDRVYRKKPTKVKTPKIVKDLRAAGGIKSSDAIKAAIKAMKSKIRKPKGIGFKGKRD